MLKIINCLTSFDNKSPGGLEISEQQMEEAQVYRFPFLSAQSQEVWSRYWCKEGTLSDNKETQLPLSAQQLILFAEHQPVYLLLGMC